MNSIAAKKREALPDFIKGVAVLLMIQVHIVELFASQSIYDSLAGKILLFLGGPPVAPVFVGIMGYYLARSGKRFYDFFKRGVILFCGGILLNILLNFNLLINIYAGSVEGNPLSYIFGCDILPLAGLSVIFLGFIRELLKERFYFYILVALAIALVAPFLFQPFSVSGNFSYILAFFGGDYSWSYFPFFPWAAYPVAGYALGLFLKSQSPEKIFREEIQWIIAAVCTICVLITWKFGFSISSTLSQYYHHDLIYFMWVIAFSAAYLVYSGFLIRNLKKHPLVIFIRWLGQHVTRVYVIQWMLIGNLATNLYKSQNPVQIIIWFVLIVTVAATLTHFSLMIKKNYFKTRRTL